MALLRYWPVVPNSHTFSQLDTPHYVVNAHRCLHSADPAHRPRVRVADAARRAENGRPGARPASVYGRRRPARAARASGAGLRNRAGPRLGGPAWRAAVAGRCRAAAARPVTRPHRTLYAPLPSGAHGWAQ